MVISLYSTMYSIIQICVYFVTLYDIVIYVFIYYVLYECNMGVLT